LVQGNGGADAAAEAAAIGKSRQTITPSP